MQEDGQAETESPSPSRADGRSSSFALGTFWAKYAGYANIFIISPVTVLQASSAGGFPPPLEMAWIENGGGGASNRAGRLLRASIKTELDPSSVCLAPGPYPPHLRSIR